MPANHKKKSYKQPASKKMSKPNSATTKHSTPLHSLTNKQLLIIASTALIVVNLVLVCAIIRVNNLKKQKNTIITLNNEKTYSGVTVQATNVKTETGYIMGIKPEEGSKLISVDVTLTNNSDQDFYFYPSIQTFVRDNEGGTFGMVPVALEQPFEATTIKPGETSNGQLSYMVPARAVPLFLYIESRQTSAGPFVIKLQ